MNATPWLVARARSTPSAPALRLPARSLSWADLEREALDVHAALVHLGVAPGDVVAVLLDSAELPLLLHGAWLAGAVVLPLNLRLTPPEIAFLLRDARARWLVHGDEALATLAAAALEEVQSGEPSGGHPVSEPLPFSQLVSGPSRARRPAQDPAPLDLEAPLAVLYTSGTTGRPKGAVLTAGNFLASARASQQLLGSRPGDRCLACLPLFHVGGLSILVRALLVGSSVHVHPGFDATAVARSLEVDGVTDVSFVANTLARVLEARGDARAPADLRCILVGGGPVPDALLRRARALGYPVAPTYGLTEATSQVATRAPGDSRACGLRPLPGVRVRVDAAPGGSGEILVRGPTVMRGYLGRDEETARALRGGWLHTGDVGRLHADGTLTVLDRRSDLIVSGGENVYPAEIEAVLLEHPGVAEAGVGSLPDDRYGARPIAWWVPVESASGRPPDEESLARFCRSRLAAFKVPVRFHRVGALPRTAAGKLRRADLARAAGRPGAAD